MVELRPLGVRCNIQCQYCYQNPQRDAGNFTGEYDMDRMKAAITAEGGPFSIFGGEPLLVPKRDLEELWSWGFSRFGGNTIQTNGTLITDDHVRMIKQYKVRVGISLDGPGELNDVRWHGSLEKTREATAKSERAIRLLCQEGIAPSLIITLHRGNASPEKLSRLYDWVRELDAMGVWFVGLHLLESESATVRDRYALSTEENIQALLGFLELEKTLSRLRFDLFPDMRRLLAGEDRTITCVWSACDPYTTAAVRGVEGQGQRSNCGRTNKDGIDFGKGNTPGYERYIALYRTPQEFGGCAGCRFFLMCKGQCPGTAIDGDWRNRTEHCEVWKAVYSRLESDLAAEGRQTLSTSPRREAVERQFLEAWSQGRVTYMADAAWKAAEPARGPDRVEPMPGVSANPLGAATERLPFTLPEFNRRSWVSEQAQSVWGPRIDRILRAWRDIEWLSVAEGVRECGLIWVYRSELAELVPRWESARLSAIELKVAASQVTTHGRICVLVGALDRIEQLRDRWAAADNEAIGMLLGYPSCCRAFFDEVWVRQRCIDTTWGMIENAPETSLLRTNGVVRIELAGEVPPLANILWRWMGVRAVPHLPCRFDCPASIAFGQRMLEVGRASGYAQEVQWITEILAWPVEWSALHGIAEVKSPLMKISTQTDATAGKRVIHWPGTRRPAEGGVGLHFPFVAPKAPLLTLSREFQRGLAHAAKSQTEPAWPYSDNGFASADAMDQLHRPIVDLAREALSGMSGNVLDLGCGNGMLLKKVCEGRGDLKPHGVDCNRSALGHARQVMPEFADSFTHGDLFDVELWDRGPGHYALALFMPGRLREAPPDRAKKVLDHLRSSSSRVLVYAYPDWAEEIGALARQVGLELDSPGGGTAAFLKFPAAIAS
jgi:uncharacterized protein